MATFSLEPSVQIIDCVPGLEDLSDEWRALWERDPAATVFQSPAWLLPWTRHLWNGGALRVVTLRRGGKLAGVAPMFVWGEGHVSWLGSGISDYLGITADPEFGGEVVGSMMRALEAMRGEWTRCDFEELREDSPVLRAATPEWMESRIEECSVCPVRCLSEPLPARLLKNVRYSERRLGTFEFGPGNWDELFRLHEARWGGEGVLRCPAVQAFHREAADRFTRLYALRVNGETIAVQYNLLAKGRACYYLSGYAPEWSACSPGSVLLRHCMDETGREGAWEFDFLRNPEPYKYAWGARDRINRRLVLTPRR